MGLNTEAVWERYSHILIPVIYFLVTVVNVKIFGVVAFYPLTALFLLVLGVLVKEMRKQIRKNDQQAFLIKLKDNTLDVLENTGEAKIAFWHHLYLSIRLDRAAFFRALTSVFPAGYRRESYMMEYPMELSGMNSGISRQNFLYFDLPADLDLPVHQLRFAVSAEEMAVIGELPEYENERTTILEGDSQEALRLYLIHVATEELRENSNADATESEAAA